MQGASLILTAYQDSLQTAMNVVANNVANSNTTGFKRTAVAFDSYLSQPTPQDSFRFAVERGIYRDAAQGATFVTGNPLDIAIQGQGYIPIQTEAGIRYTRAGSFQLDGEGSLVTASGDKVLDDGNQPLSFPADATDILIGSDGTISAKSGGTGTVAQVGKLSIFMFKNEKDLASAGENLYLALQTPEINPEGKVVQGAVEQSNVRGIEEMTRMIEISRAYQRVANLLSTEHQRQTNAIQRLGKASA